MSLLFNALRFTSLALLPVAFSRHANALWRCDSQLKLFESALNNFSCVCPGGCGSVVALTVLVGCLGCVDEEFYFCGLEF